MVDIGHFTKLFFNEETGVQFFEKQGKFKSIMANSGISGNGI